MSCPTHCTAIYSYLASRRPIKKLIGRALGLPGLSNSPTHSTLVPYCSLGEVPLSHPVKSANIRFFFEHLRHLTFEDKLDGKKNMN